MGEERAHEVLPLSEEILQLLAAWRGASLLFRDVVPERLPMPQYSTYRKHWVDSGCLKRALTKFRRKTWDGRGRTGEEMGVSFDLNIIYAWNSQTQNNWASLFCLTTPLLKGQEGRYCHIALWPESPVISPGRTVLPVFLFRSLFVFSYAHFYCPAQSRLGTQWKNEELGDNKDTISWVNFCLSPWLIFLLLDSCFLASSVACPRFLHIAYCYAALKVFSRTRRHQGLKLLLRLRVALRLYQ